MVVIPNGFDTLPDPASAAPPSGAFTIMHVGEFYGSRQPDALIDVLADLALPDLEFVQVGSAPAAFNRLGGRQRFRQIASVPREQAIGLMQSASLLYLRAHDSEDFASMAVPAKTYEYLSTGVPILVEGGDGAAADLVRDYGTDSVIVQPGSRDGLRAAVLRAYDRRHESRRPVDPRFAARFNRRAQTIQLAAVLDAAVAGQDLRQVVGP
jgi:hypothetical protein